MRIIGTDLDGTVTLTSLTNFNNSRLPWWFASWLILVRANEKIIAILREFARKGDTIIIISARPKQLEGLTRWWLKIHRVPFDQLLLVGKGNGVAERKFEIIKQMKIKKFFDDDLEIVKFLKEHGINARLP